jgi:hypothetical protein
MKQNKSIIIINLIWEVLRFIFLFLFTVKFFLLQINNEKQGIYWLFAVSSSSLLLPLVLIIFINNPNRILLRVFYIGKILQIFPLLMLIVSEIFKINFSINHLIGEFVSRNFILVLSFIFIDLLFSSLLLSYNIRGDYNNNQMNNNLPDKSDIPVSDVSVENKDGNG